MNVDLVQPTLAWILTYTLHSSALLVGAWMLSRLLRGRALRLREAAWKTALFGAPLTASLQLFLDVAPLAGRLDLGEPSAPDTRWVAPHPDALAARALETLEFHWQSAIVGAWMLGGLFGTLLLALAWRRIADHLHGRRLVGRGPLRAELEVLAAAAHLARAPRLTASRRLNSPATLGVLFPQICIPTRALEELSPQATRAMLAHELGHIVRRDPLWQLLARLTERILFFQPLNRVARVELEELAEFLADDWAVSVTRDELALARCLTEVATWVLRPRPAVGLVPMAARSSRLGERVGRLLESEQLGAAHGARPVQGLACAGALALVVTVAPGAAEVDAPPRLDPFGGAPSVVLAASVLAPEVPRPQAPPWDALLGELDLSLEALASEVGGLAEELDLAQVASRERATTATIRARLEALRACRADLHRLAPELELRVRRPNRPRSISYEEGTR